MKMTMTHLEHDRGAAPAVGEVEVLQPPVVLQNRLQRVVRHPEAVGDAEDAEVGGAGGQLVELTRGQVVAGVQLQLSVHDEK